MVQLWLHTSRGHWEATQNKFSCPLSNTPGRVVLRNDLRVSYISKSLSAEESRIPLEVMYKLFYCINLIHFRGDQGHLRKALGKGPISRNQHTLSFPHGSSSGSPIAQIPHIPIYIPAVAWTYPPRVHMLESLSSYSYVGGILRWDIWEVNRVRLATLTEEAESQLACLLCLTKGSRDIPSTPLAQPEVPS